ncbi:leukocyte elastase inhibitor [Dermacentor silvarum]|uniref:leukocyte elastase inhibitor n=1 Tax=Dermacentor silvarum TaxID=543639 RepID=UPI00189995AC|nr:leukocyte elastase inhibitor [Dermacentor silvarum]
MATWLQRRRAHRASGRPVLQHFSLQLYRALSSERLNVFISPFGTAVALVTALAGSRGDTAEQILAALGASHEEEILEELRTVGRILEPLSTLHVGLANKMYLSTSLELADSFKEAIHQEFGGQVGIVNFQGDPALAVKEINAWLYRVTGHKMCNVASVSDISLSTRVLMVSTSFLRCLWLDKFSELYTAPMPFFADDGKISVPTMCSRRICNYCHVERLACRVLELPCMMEHLQLLILLPDPQSDLAYIEANITPRDVHEFERRYTRNPLDITLPKFMLDEHVNMARYLAAVGVRDLFNKEEADLTGISDEKELCVHDFMSRSRFEVTDEDPVRLDLGGSNTLKLAERTDLASFEVNRPFMFLVGRAAAQGHPVHRLPAKSQHYVSSPSDRRSSSRGPDSDGDLPATANDREHALINRSSRVIHHVRGLVT